MGNIHKGGHGVSVMIENPLFRHFTNVLINRVKVNELPEEIDKHFFLYHVLLYGRVLFFKHNEKYHVFWFGGGGDKNEYHIQSDFIITNPWLPNSNTLNFNEENSAIVYSDVTAYLNNTDVGLLPLVERYANTVTTIDKSIDIIAKNARLLALLTGSTNSFVQSARQFVKQAFDNNEAFLFMEESLVDSIKSNPLTDKMEYKLSELIKARQYYISDFYQKIGVSANQNMKKERLTDDESQLIDNVSCVDFKHILDYLNHSIEKVNKLFGLSISFELNEEKEKEVEDEDKGDEKDEEKSTQRDLDSDDDKGDGSDE